MNHATKITTAFGIIIVVATLSIVVVTATSFIIPSAFALTRFFNCTTAVANKVGNLTIENVDSCYVKKFPWEVVKTNSQQQHNTTTTSVANSINDNNNSREKLPLVDTGSSSGNHNNPSSSFATTITTPMTTGPNLSSDDNNNNSSGSNRNFSTASSIAENNNNNVVSSQKLNKLFQCFQQAAFDGDGLGLNEVASCYTQVLVGNNNLPPPTVARDNSFNSNSNQLQK